ncbi:DUF6023 family protein [Actinoplanes solisilvae]|uniref:DUF6023 family protein n=1 Tax=Actinoplanes solisilvae TaxID=2486853 RepID=UPI000FD81FAC|nr:DUF6023 family protein [Actinoplanes solisilvae]
MTGERARGAVLYAAAAALVAGGATWWFLSAPPDRGSDQVKQWQAAVEQALPDTDEQIDAETATLAAGDERPFVTAVDTDEYLVSVVCRGGPDTYVRVSLSESGRDSGQGLRCSDERRPDSFKVGLADELRLYVIVGEPGPVVFRYSLQRVPS